MRLIVIASVDQRAEAGDHLDHRGVEVLPESVRHQHGIRHRGVRYKAVCPGFVREVDPRLEAEIKDVLKFSEVFLPFAHGHFHERHVAGPLDGL